MSSFKSTSCCGKTTAVSENVFEECIFHYKDESNQNFIIYNRKERENGVWVINTYLLPNIPCSLLPTKISKELAIELLSNPTNIFVTKGDINIKNKVFDKIRSVRETNIMLSKLQGSKSDNKRSVDEQGLLSEWRIACETAIN
jgi:hypothetical protein